MRPFLTAIRVAALLALMSFQAPRAASRLDLVDPRSLSPRILAGLRYATNQNPCKRPLYARETVLLRRGTAEKLARAQALLAAKGYRVKILDAYRPPQAQAALYACASDKRYVANPRRGSRHTRGAAVDVTLADTLGRELPMPSAYDEFSPRSHANYRGGTAEQRANRATLRRAMEQAGFRVNSREWWHFDDKDWRRYSLLTQRL